MKRNEEQQGVAKTIMINILYMVLNVVISLNSILLVEIL